MFYVVSMVVHHVEDDGNTRLMKGIHHLLELTDAAVGVVRIRGIAAFGHVIVHRIVTPVILIVTQTCLVHRAIVIAGQDVHGIDTQRFQVFNGPRFRQSHELPGVFGIRACNREVAMMQLVNNEIGRRLNDGMLVTAPVFRERLLPVNDGTTFTIDANGLGKHARTLATSHVEGIELVHQVASDSCCPNAVLLRHLDGLQSLAALSILIDTNHHLLGISRCKELERGLLWRISHLVELEILSQGSDK